jgi:hypothetical protein
MSGFAPGTRVRYIGEHPVGADYFPSGRKCVPGTRYPNGTEAVVDGEFNAYVKVLLKLRWSDGYMSSVDSRDVEVLDG